MQVTDNIQSTSLGLVGDGDEIDLIEHCEHVFKVDLPDETLMDVETVGELYDLLAKITGARSRSSDKCYSQIGFYKLKTRLFELGFAQPITPATKLDDLLRERGWSFKQIRHRVNTDLVEKIPFPEVPASKRAISAFLRLVSLVVWPILILVISSNFPTTMLPIGTELVLIVFTVIVSDNLIVRSMATEVPHCCETIGGLARFYGTKCFDEDCEATIKASAKNIWDRLSVCLRSETDYGGRIDRQTRLI